MSSRLAIFDVDGTLLRTSGVDDECYIQAMDEVFGIRGMSTDWGSYSHSTDGAILADLIRQRLGREPTASDAATHRSRFVELLQAVAAKSPERFAQTPGASAAMQSLRERGWTTAIATGGWRASALLKLERGGLDVTGTAAAFADDALPREAIILHAAARATVGPEPRVVYIGDGLWDLRAANRLAIGFVGIASGERAEALRAAGAVDVLADFSNGEAFLRALEQALPATSLSDPTTRVADVTR